MPSQQFSVRISSTLDKRIKEFAKVHNITKTKIMIDALNHYLGCVEKVPLNQELNEIKQKISAIELAIKNKN
ncbi:MAG: hypothetical protein WBF90_32220 [Rivularia sp. (in: cyanobacteria)]